MGDKMSRDNPLRATKQQRKRLFDCHVGVGFLVIKLMDNMVYEVEVCTIKGVLCRIGDGKPVFPLELHDEDDPTKTTVRA